MSSPTESYLKVNYELRPAKQVERRMMIDALQQLAQAGVPIRDYQYTGMGSVYYVDFVLVHKLLGITRMLSVEYSKSIRKRIVFNKPFGLVDVGVGPVSDFIPRLDRDARHFLWLDYDCVLSRSHLEDLALATTFLSSGSFLVITVDVEPPLKDRSKPSEWRRYFLQEGREYIGEETSIQEFARSKLPKVNAGLIGKAIKAGLKGRQVEFLPLFHFLYSDGHQMLTLGGMIGTSTELERIKASRLATCDYIRLDLSTPPYEIKVPRLTRRERLLLDSHMPSRDGWLPKDFELSIEDVIAYRSVYRFFPAYAELLL